MNKIIIILIGIIGFLIMGGLGNIMHNYEVNKCNNLMVSDNQYYEAKSDCYMPMERPSWNLFWNIFFMEFIFIVIYILLILFCFWEGY